jgi:DNA-binding MarR family transcriptional regulator
MQFQRDILDSIRRIFRSLRESSRAAEVELGLSGAQLLILHFLKSGIPLSVNELAERTRTHQSSVSGVVAKLVEAELVKRQVSSADGRKAQICLTAAGGRILKKKSSKLAQERLLTAVSDLPLAKQKQLAELLVQVVAAAGFADEPATLFFEEDRVKRIRRSKKD